MVNTVEVIPRRLIWMSDMLPPKGGGKSFYFCVDGELSYAPFFSDFGPLSLAQVFRFIIELEKLLRSPEARGVLIYHYTNLVSYNRVNAAFVMGCFMIAKLGMEAEEVWAKFAVISPPFVAYRDASYGPCSYKCTLRHCLRGFEHGLKARLIDLGNFDLKSFEFYEKTQNGDLSWVVPRKLIAFATPYDKKTRGTLQACDYLPIFKKLGVTQVIRLNQPNYDREVFLQAGLRHLDLFFPDGSVPQPQLVRRFLEAVEAEKGVTAVHCKAGLGRTGVLISLYLMKHFHFCGADVISFMRIMRPGSVLGPQQHFLVEKQAEAWSMSPSLFDSASEDFKTFAEKMKNSADSRQKPSFADLEIGKKGQVGQGDALLSAKNRVKLLSHTSTRDH